MKCSEKIDLISAALVAAQDDLEHAPLDSENPHFRSKFASLKSILNTVRPALSKQGIAILQPVDGKESGGVEVSTVLLHTSGQFVSCTMAIRPDKPTPQGLGSAASYGRRYTLGIVGIATDEDDDGEAADGRGRDTGNRGGNGNGRQRPPQQRQGDDLPPHMRDHYDRGGNGGGQRQGGRNGALDEETRKNIWRAAFRMWPENKDEAGNDRNRQHRFERLTHYIHGIGPETAEIHRVNDLTEEQGRKLYTMLNEIADEQEGR